LILFQQAKKTSDNRYRDLVLGYFCKNEFDKCIEISKNIKELEPRSWIFLMYSFKEIEGFDNLKEKEEFKNKFDEYSKLDWENTIKGFHLPDESMNKNLENFSNELVN
jgi:hypothetical protein